MKIYRIKPEGVLHEFEKDVRSLGDVRRLMGRKAEPKLLPATREFLGGPAAWFIDEGANDWKRNMLAAELRRITLAPARVSLTPRGNVIVVTGTPEELSGIRAAGWVA